MFNASSFLFIAVLTFVTGVQLFAVKLPDGLVLHLDASHKHSVILDNKSVMEWHDLSQYKNNAVAVSRKYTPVYIEKGLNNLGMVSFNGGQVLKTSPINLPDGISVFMVFRRGADQAKGKPWQCSVFWGDIKVADNTPQYHLDMGRNRGFQSPTLCYHSVSGSFNNPIVIGQNGGDSGFLYGDIGELLIFNRNKLSLEEINLIQHYLYRKWNFHEDDWVRIGPLPEGPKRKNHLYPLSDQDNKGKWVKLDKLSDEFEGSTLDRSKWTDLLFYSHGPAPARYLPENVMIKDGMANLISRFDSNMPSGRFEQRGKEYHSYSVARLESMHLFRYGYIEIRAKIMASSMACNFWLIGRGIEHDSGRDAVPEIDVFELAGKSFAHTYKYNMALHYVQHGPVRKHFAYGRNWNSNFKFTDDYHVYGVEWTPEKISYFIDGLPVRVFNIKKNYWDVPMTLILNTAPMFDWFGVPDKNDFPATFAIDYVRFWKNPDTDIPDDWSKKYKIRHKPRNKGLIYNYFETYGKSREIPELPVVDHQTVNLGVINKLSAAVAWKSFHGGAVKWLPVSNDLPAGGVRFYFPAVAERKDNGEVQYAVPVSDFPVISINVDALTVTNWQKYLYMKINYFNPSENLQTCMLKVSYGKKHQVWQQAIVMKPGRGIQYFKLANAFKAGKINKLSLSVRGRDKATDFVIENLELERKRIK
jgi:beta-glucanase (GH16 family)